MVNSSSFCIDGSMLNIGPPTSFIRRNGKRWLVAIAAAVSLVVASPSSAQSTNSDTAALEEAYDKAFQALFADPGNLEKSFAFAKIAIQLGNYEAAVSALERMLLVNPNLPRVRLELGVLYFRMGSYQLARTYLTRAIEGADTPSDVKGRVDRFLAEIDDRLSVHSWSGTAYAGLRWQNNANAGPITSGVLVSGVPATLANEFTAKKDENIFISGSVKHVYDFQSQDGTTFETNGVFYGSQQRKQASLDLVFIEANGGPRTVFDSSYTGTLNYRPYVMLNYIALADARYMTAYGLGLDGSRAFGERFLADVKVQHKERRFRDSNTRTTNSRQNGGESLVKFSGR